MSNSLDPQQSRVRRRPAPRRSSAGAARAALDHGLLPGLLGYQLRLAQQAVFRDFERAADGLGVSPGRFGMLVLIEANPGVSQSRLAQEIGLDRSTLVAILDVLEETRLVERRAGEDRRSNALWLTRRGKGVVERMKARVAEHEARIAARLTPAEQATLLDLLGRLGSASK
jgi:DNA-binding MarR family transcriptional regulator